VMSDPLRVQFELGTQVLKAMVLKISREVNGIRIEPASASRS